MAYTLQHNSRFSFFSSRKCCSYYTMSTMYTSIMCSIRSSHHHPTTVRLASLCFVSREDVVAGRPIFRPSKAGTMSDQMTWTSSVCFLCGLFSPSSLGERSDRSASPTFFAWAMSESYSSNPLRGHHHVEDGRCVAGGCCSRHKHIGGQSREDAKDNLLLHNALHVVHVH